MSSQDTGISVIKTETRTVVPMVRTINMMAIAQTAVVVLTTTLASSCTARLKRIT